MREFDVRVSFLLTVKSCRCHSSQIHVRYYLTVFVTAHKAHAAMLFFIGTALHH